jgi:hypothetical protein
MTRSLFWLSTAILVFMSLLTLSFGWAMTPPDHVYTGLHSLSPGDYLVYYSYLEQVRQGAVGFRDLFTGEPQTANLILPVWLAVGWVGNLLHTSPPVAYHLARILSIPVLLAAIAAAARCFIPDRRLQRLAFLFAVFAGGLGFILGPIEQHFWGRDIHEHLWPMDLWVSEGFTYLSAAQSPHFLLGTAALLFFIVELVRVLERGVRWRTLLVGVGACLLIATSPFLILLMIALSLAALVLSRSTRVPFRTRLARLFCLWFPTLPALAYVGLYQAFDELARARATQNILPTTVWWVTLVSYGLLLPLAAWGVRHVWSDRSWRARFLLAWLVAQPILFYGPVFFQRRLVQGWHVPLAFFAAIGAYALLRQPRLLARRRLQHTLIGVGIFFLIGSPLYQLGNDFALFTEARGRLFSAFYIPRQVAEGYGWVKANTSPDALILAERDYAPFITAFSGRRTYVGHGVETIDFEQKRLLARRVFANDYTADALLQLAQSEGWTHVWVSKAETRFGFDLSRYPFLEVEFSNPELTIARVRISD